VGKRDKREEERVEEGWRRGREERGRGGGETREKESERKVKNQRKGEKEEEAGGVKMGRKLKNQ